MKSFQASFLIVFLLVFGCDRGQQMIKPVMSEKPVVEQPITDTTVETPVTDIFTDIDLPPEPTIPVGADVLDTDHVFHATSAEVQEWAGFRDFVFVNTANEAYESKEVIGFFNDTKEWAEAHCGTNESPRPPEVDIYFRNRDERETFKESLPGTWTTNLFDDDKWWYIREGVGIIDSKDVYYTLLLTAEWDPCIFRDQPE